MRIWVDLANSPQVLFFHPILEVLAELGHETLVTCRNFAQTAPLAVRFEIQAQCIGRHGGQRISGSASANVERVGRLIGWALRHRPLHLAVSHNSYSQVLAARLLNIPVVTLMDYEHQPLNHICFRLARRVIVPDCFPNSMLARCGALRKAYRYPGFKEQVYLSRFSPGDDFATEFRLPADAVRIAMRPPAPWAMYHRFENPLFDDVFHHLARRADTFIVFLPRVTEQADFVRQLGYRNVWIPPRTLDGPTLVATADLVVSGGGTMNREAAVLGTPAYTVFSGKPAAVDRELIRLGRMMSIATHEDIQKIRVEKKNSLPPLVGESLDKRLTELILRR